MFFLLLIAATSIGVAVAIYVFRNPPVAFALVLLMFGIEQLATSTAYFFVAHSSLINLAVGGLVLVGIGGQLALGSRFFIGYPPVAWLAMLLYAIAFSSLVWTPAPQAAWKNWLNAYPYVITGVVLLPLLVRTVDDLRQGLTFVLSIGAILVVCLNLFGQWEGRGLKLAGGEGGSNPHAVAQVAAYVILAVVLLSFRRVARIWDFLRWFLVAAAMLLIARSSSRGQFLFLLSCLFIMYPLSRDVKGAFSIASAGLAVGVLSAIAGWMWGEYLAGQSRWSAEGLTEDTFGRLEMAKALLLEWAEKPSAWLFGLGNSAAYDIVGYYPHVVPLEVLGEEGLIGLAAFAVFVWFTVRSFLRLVSLLPTDRTVRAAVVTLAALVLFEFLLMWKQGNLLGSTLFFGLSIILIRLERLASMRANRVSL